MENTVLPWLNEPFLIQVLQSFEESKQDVEVIQFLCRPAVPPGSNNLSHLYRIMVDYKIYQTDSFRSISLIIKTPLTSGMMKDFMERNNWYKKEVKIYTKILPVMYELYNVQLTPKSYFCPLDSSLVLEDLSAGGYRMADRLKQLDFHHCHHFLVTLARFHALSVAVLHIHPQLIQSVGEHCLYDDQTSEEEQKEKRDSNNTLLRGMVNTIDKLDGCRKYADIIKDKIDSYWEKMVQLVKSRRGLNVLNHGDTWTTNVMFRYNDAGNVIDAKLVDFQLAQFRSFTLDIIFFWWSSANEYTREHCREELFEVYRKTLNCTLNDLKCSETVSKEDFDSQIKENASYSIFVLAVNLPFALANPENLIDLNDLNAADISTETDDSSSALWKNFESKYYRAVLPRALRQAEEFGAFD